MINKARAGLADGGSRKVERASNFGVWRSKMRYVIVAGRRCTKDETLESDVFCIGKLCVRMGG